jgi:hypothetical protein
MTTRAKYRGGRQSFFDDQQSFETVHRMAGLAYRDDFLGAGSATIPAAGAAVQGCDWVKKLVGGGAPTVAQLAAGGGGVIRCALDNTNEKQEATLYWNDAKAIDVTKGFVWEARVNLHVLPSAAGVQAAWGVSSSWIDGPDNAAEYLQFGATANGNVNMRSQDAVTQSSIASGLAVVADAFHVYRMDAFDLTDVKYFIDGQQVSANNALKFAAVGANAVLQPYFSVYKAAGVGVATLDVDYVKVWNDRQ